MFHSYVYILYLSETLSISIISHPGFYLGDRISVITKTCERSTVLEFTLDKSKFEDDYRRKEEVFAADLFFREIGDPIHSFSEYLLPR